MSMLKLVGCDGEIAAEIRRSLRSDLEFPQKLQRISECYKGHEEAVLIVDGYLFTAVKFGSIGGLLDRAMRYHTVGFEWGIQRIRR